jgi:hypothetical protein
MRPALTIRMENQPSAGAATFRKLANAGRLPQQALDRDRGPVRHDAV